MKNIMRVHHPRRRGLQRQHSPLLMSSSSLLLFSCHVVSYHYGLCHRLAVALLIVFSFANNDAFVPPSSAFSKNGLQLSNIIAATTARSSPQQRQRQQRRQLNSNSVAASVNDKNDDDTSSLEINNDSNPPASSFTWSTSTATTSTLLRAGESGYSVSRRPITTLDPNILPTFVTTPPRDMAEDSQRSAATLQQSWRSESSKKKNKRPWLDETKTLDGLHDEEDDDNTNENENDDEDELLSLDLHERTLTSLDYHFVLQALANECNTMFGIELVLGRMELSFTKEGKKKKQTMKRSSGGRGSSSDMTNQQRQQRGLIHASHLRGEG